MTKLFPNTVDNGAGFQVEPTVRQLFDATTMAAIAFRSSRTAERAADYANAILVYRDRAGPKVDADLVPGLLELARWVRCPA